MSEQHNLRTITLNLKEPGTENVALTIKILSGSIIFSFVRRLSMDCNEYLLSYSQCYNSLINMQTL